jgi:hypothetical protein
LRDGGVSESFNQSILSFDCIVRDFSTMDAQQFFSVKIKHTHANPKHDMVCMSRSSVEKNSTFCNANENGSFVIMKKCG